MTDHRSRVYMHPRKALHGLRGPLETPTDAGAVGAKLSKRHGGPDLGLHEVLTELFFLRDSVLPPLW